MARHKKMDTRFSFTTEPDWPTQKKKLYDDGRAIGIDNSVWCYRGVELSPIDSARSVREGVLAARPLLQAFEEIAKITQVSVGRRNMAKSAYRDVHVLLVNIPERFNPTGKMYETPLRRQFPRTNVQRRILLFGVKLRTSVRSNGNDLGSIWNSIVDGFDPQQTQVNLRDYDRDYGLVEGALSRAGLFTPSEDEFRIADSWWNAGRFPDTPYLVHSDHLHMFTGSDSLADARRLQEDRVDCRDQAWKRLPRHHTLSMVAYAGMGKEFTEIGTVDTHWCSELLAMGAAAVSVRGKVEPGKITHNQIRSGRRTQTNDLLEANRDGTVLGRAEQEETRQMLDHMESAYAGADAPTTLIEVSIVAALSGSDEQGSFDVNGKSSRIILANMSERQERALSEMMLCSSIRANPNLKDLPAAMVAYSGMPSLSVVGDKDGALLGFTELDHQPAYVSSNIASATDSQPIMCVVGQTGSGKRLPLSTRLATPTGWITVADVEVGTILLGRRGEPVKVSAIYPIEDEPDMAELSLSDGTAQQADAEHQFIVSTLTDRHARIPALEQYETEIAFMRELRTYAEQHHDDLSACSVSQLRSDLVREFGSRLAWSGNESMSASLAHMRIETDDEGRYVRGQALTALATRLGERLNNKPIFSVMERRMTVAEMRAEHQPLFIHAPAPLELPDIEWEGDLVALGRRLASRCEAIPTPLLRAGLGQREQLWRGYSEVTGLNFSTTSVCHRSVVELARTLGKVVIEQGDAIRVTQSPWIEVRSITDVAPSPARCLTVADGDHAFLAGDGFLPTSNTQALLWLAYNWAQPTPGRPKGIPQIIVDPKLLRLSTLIPTPHGWTTVSDIQVGDQIFHRTGQVATVTDKSRIYSMDEVEMFRVRLDDGRELYADLAHQFVVADAKRLTADAPACSGSDVYRVRMAAERAPVSVAESAHEIYSRLLALGVTRYASGEEIAEDLQRYTEPLSEEFALWDVRHALDMLAKQLEEERTRGTRALSARTVENLLSYSETQWAIPVVGIEGSHRSDLALDELYYQGCQVGRGSPEAEIPEGLEFASRPQRLRFVQGVMDHCGFIEDGVLCARLGSPALQRSVVEILRSLGVKTARQDTVTVTLDTDEQVFGSSPLCDIQPVASPLAGWNLIDSIDDVQPEAGQCLSVDSPDHTYLAGDFILTHNTESDHTVMIESMGGTVRSFDEIQLADGALDPLRFTATGEVGVEAAASMLMQVNPWGPRRDEWEVPLVTALRFGVENGAKCIGRALQIALDNKEADPAMVTPVLRTADAMPMFSACVGRDDDAPGLRVSEGVTLLKLGSTQLELPNPGKEPNGMPQRIGVAVVRMMVFGSMAALMGRSGVLHFDEAWIAMSGGAEEVQRVGRLARQQDVLPILYTQRVSDLVNNDLTNYISRGLILAIEDPVEAEAACLLFRLEPTKRRLDRIRAKAEKIGGSRSASGAPNWESLRALFVPDPSPEEPDRRRNIRGSVALYVDIKGQVAPVEIRLPEQFLEDSSTNPNDIRRREARRAAQRLEDQERAERESDNLRRVAAEAEVSAEVHRMAQEDGSVMAGASAVDLSDMDFG